MRLFSLMKGAIWGGVFVLVQVISCADLVVTNVTAQQRSGGTSIVDIQFDLVGRASNVIIEIHYSILRCPPPISSTCYSAIHYF